ncbi:hypothetical protein KSP39_PZI014703 [Platanthera zijinensis]|uniref:Uncharacterized protein n=1 Tax=Platanthera zijinensis TaxID=2320716 RepID=A0AAP0B9Y2_9ASPA
MDMSTDSNMNFQNGVFASSFYNQHADSFQPGMINNTAGLLQGGFSSSGGINGSSTMVLAGNPATLYNGSLMVLEGSSSSNPPVDLVAGLKHDTGLAADWSYKEQALLRHGLIKYVDQPSIMKYVKIAALLPEKSVRDVALRSQWMTRKENGKRRKLEEYYVGKRCKDRKERMGDSSMNVNIYPFGNVVGYPFMMHDVNNNNSLSLFMQIHDNVNLFLRSRNNITIILNSMSGMPGIMSLMPPLPVSVNEDLVTSILPSTRQVRVYTFIFLLSLFLP